MNECLGQGNLSCLQSVKPVLCLLVQLLWMSSFTAAAKAHRSLQEEKQHISSWNSLSRATLQLVLKCSYSSFAHESFLNLIQVLLSSEKLVTAVYTTHWNRSHSLAAKSLNNNKTPTFTSPCSQVPFAFVYDGQTLDERVKVALCCIVWQRWQWSYLIFSSGHKAWEEMFCIQWVLT